MEHSQSDLMQLYLNSVLCAAIVKTTRKKETLDGNGGHGGFHKPNGQLQLRLKLPSTNSDMQGIAPRVTP